MSKTIVGAAFCCALMLVGVTWPSHLLAQTSATRSSSFGYDAASGLMTSEVIEPNTPAFRLETVYTHDAFGNRNSTTVGGVDIVTRSESRSYDTQGRFPLSVTNALGQSESWQHHPVFGTPTSHTGPNGLTTTWSYDGFGRKMQEVRADGTQTKWAYLFCSGFNGGTAACPSGAVYQIKTTPFAIDGTTQNGPISIVYFDSLNREVARDSQGFDASVIRASTQYDGRGRVQKKSRPYFVSGGTPQWTTYGYDTLSRVTLETFPDSTTMSYGFQGLVTTNTNARNQTRTVTKNSLGLMVSVRDALTNLTWFAYDPFGNLTQTTDAAGNVITATYDVRGRKIANSDPDMGSWTYTYNTLGELITQTDAKNQTTALSYDKLGRVVERAEPDMTSAWVFDTAAHGIGKVASESITAGPSAGFQRAYSYDALTRPVQVATTVASSVYAISGSYDANARLATVTYPSGFAVNYAYTSLGDAAQLTNAATSQVYWTANARDAEMRLTQETAGNGIVTSRGFDALTARLMSITAGAGNAVQDVAYTYDLIGNLATRADANTSLSESLGYDELNRLTSSTVALTPTPLVKTLTYSPIGNLLSKSDVGTYTYPAAGTARPHAVTSISGGTINTSFSYDSNGNQTAGLGRTITWTSYNKPASITQGTRTVSFSYDMDHARFKQVSPEGTTLYFEAFGVRAEQFSASMTQWNEYLMVGGGMVAVRFNNVSAGTVATRYVHDDHLGSVAILTDENGVVVERNSYDAWGKRRFPGGTDDPAGSIASQTTRGFTGQEELSAVGLVHFNARVYDPIVARFASADSIVPYPGDGQSYNRYSYVRNRPLSAVDPSGHVDVPRTNVLPTIVISPNGPTTIWNWAPPQYSAQYYNSMLPRIGSFPAGALTQYYPYPRPAYPWAYATTDWTRPTPHAPAPAQAAPPPASAGFAIGSIAYGYAGSALSATGDFLGECAEMCPIINYFTGSYGLRRGVGGLLDLCGVACEVGTYMSVRSGVPAIDVLPTMAGGTLSVLRTYGTVGRLGAAAKSTAVNPMRAGQLAEIEQAAAFGSSGKVSFTPTPAQIDSAAFKIIVGEAKYTRKGAPVGTIYDASRGGGLGEIKTGSSVLDSSYQLRLQTYGALVNDTPLTIYTSRPVNATFDAWLTRWGVTVQPLPK